MRTLRDVISCHWAARRLQRHLDSDPSAPLTPEESARLQAHLLECARCRGLRDEFRGLSRLLMGLRSPTDPSLRSVARMRELAAAVRDGRPT